MYAASLLALFLGHALASPPSAELELRWSTFPDEATQGRMVYLDVLGAPVPPIELEDAAGNRYRLNLRLEHRPQSEELIIRPHLFELRTTRKGDTLVPLGDTEVRTTDGARASVRFGTDGRNPPKKGIELDFVPRVGAGPQIPPPPPPRTEDEGAERAPGTPAPSDDEFIEASPSGPDAPPPETPPATDEPVN